MCVTAFPAKLNNTIVGTWEIHHPKYRYRHVLAYQNSPQNLAKGPNCMLLHIPADEPIKPEHVLDTSGRENKDLLNSIAQKAVRPLQHIIGARGMSSGSSRNYVHQMGIYHIAILNDLSQASATLAKIPKNKRPQISKKLFQFYKKTFPKFPLVLCCFDNKDSADSSPILIHYSPKNAEVFMLPTVESHGGLPQLQQEVEFDRIVIIGTQNTKAADHAMDIPHNCAPHLRLFLPLYGYVEWIEGRKRPNADVLFPREELFKEGMLDLSEKLAKPVPSGTSWEEWVEMALPKRTYDILSFPEDHSPKKGFFSRLFSKLFGSSN